MDRESTNKKLSGVVEAYDGLISDMRKEGYTLERIGKRVGVSRERVRQVIERYYPEAESLFLAEEQVARLLGCSSACRIAGLRKQGILHPRRIDRFWLYSPDEVNIAVQSLRRFCIHCGVELSFRGGGRYCPACRTERKRYNYPFLSEEQKQKFRARANRWKKSHPDRTREMNRKASKNII